MVPKNRLFCSSRGEWSALLPAMNALFAVRAGIPNQNNGISTRPPAIIRRMAGIVRHAHSA